MCRLWSFVAPRAAAALALSTLAACGDARTGPSAATGRIPATITLVTPDKEYVPFGEPIPVVPKFVVHDAAGRPVAGVTVHFAVYPGVAAPRDSVVRTDADGFATPGDWTLQPNPGEQTLAAYVIGLTGPRPSVSAYRVPGPATTVRTTSPAATTPPAATLGATVTVLDRFGYSVLTNPSGAPSLPLPQVVVTQSDPADSIVAGAPAGSTGVVPITWRVSYTPGVHTVTVRVAGLTTTFTTTVTAPAYKPTVVPGGPLTARMLDSVTNAAILLTDSAGKPRAGVRVRFTLVSGMGRLNRGNVPVVEVFGDTSFTTLSDSFGMARLGTWLLGLTPGPQHVRADIEGVEQPVDIVATATATLVYLRATQVSVGTTLCALQPGSQTVCGGGGLTLPRPVEGPAFVRIAVGGPGLGCGLTAAGQAYCFRPIPPSPYDYESTPVAGAYVSTPVAGAPPLRTIAAGAATACGLTAAGIGWCWGDNSSGQLGDGTTFPRATAVPLGNQPTLVDISLVQTTVFSSGGNVLYGCGLTPAGSPLCWGTLPDSGLTISTSFSYTVPTVRALVPSPIAAGPPLVSLAPGGPLCGLTADGTAVCWRTVRQAPSIVSATLRFTRLASNGYRACGLTPGGEVWCWTIPLPGQNAAISAPVQESGELSFSDVSVGASTTCATAAADGSVYCWSPGTRPARVVLRVDP